MLIVRMASLLRAFSSSPSVSTRPKHFTGCDWVQLAVDIIEISKTFLLWYPSFPSSSSSFPVSSYLFVLHIEMHFSQEVCLKYLYPSSWILHHPAPGHGCGLCLGLPFTTDFVLMLCVAEGLCLPCLPHTQL